VTSNAPFESVVGTVRERRDAELLAERKLHAPTPEDLSRGANSTLADPYWFRSVKAKTSNLSTAQQASSDRHADELVWWTDPLSRMLGRLGTPKHGGLSPVVFPALQKEPRLKKKLRHKLLS
jgi:hypothetical protein